MKKVLATTTEDIKLDDYNDLPSALLSAKVTASGNYVLELRGAGYGINGNQWHASGEYIYIRVSMTKEGKIIDCLTVSQKETNGIGSACADKDFYSQFICFWSFFIFLSGEKSVPVAFCGIYQKDSKTAADFIAAVISEQHCQHTCKHTENQLCPRLFRCGGWFVQHKHCIEHNGTAQDFIFETIKV